MGYPTLGPTQLSKEQAGLLSQQLGITARAQAESKAYGAVRFKPASKKPLEPDAAAQTSDPNTVKAEAGGLRAFKQAELSSETLSQSRQRPGGGDEVGLGGTLYENCIKLLAA